MGKFTEDHSSQSEFYESIPFSGNHYIYRDDVPATHVPLPNGRSDRTFAIITLLLMALVAAAIGLLLAWGIQSLQSTQAGATLIESR